MAAKPTLPRHCEARSNPKAMGFELGRVRTTTLVCGSQTIRLGSCPHEPKIESPTITSKWLYVLKVIEIDN